jgi:hypothetical protein
LKARTAEKKDWHSVCNEIVMMEGSEPVNSNTQRTNRPALQAVKEAFGVAHVVPVVSLKDCCIDF